MRLKWVSLMLVGIGLARGARGQDLTTEQIKQAMRAEWIRQRSFCLKALEMYAQKPDESQKAAAELARGVPARMRDLYDFAGKKDSAAFFQLLATAYSPRVEPDCRRADSDLIDEFDYNVVALQNASAALQSTGDLAAFAIVLAGLQAPDDLPDNIERDPVEHLLACNAVAPKHVLNKVNEILGVH